MSNKPAFFQVTPPQSALTYSFPPDPRPGSNGLPLAPKVKLDDTPTLVSRAKQVELLRESLDNEANGGALFFEVTAQAVEAAKAAEGVDPDAVDEAAKKASAKKAKTASAKE